LVTRARPPRPARARNFRKGWLPEQGKGVRTEVTPKQRIWAIRIGLFVVILVVIIIATR
jgi:hypothetical protein